MFFDSMWNDLWIIRNSSQVWWQWRTKVYQIGSIFLYSILFGLYCDVVDVDACQLSGCGFFYLHLSTRFKRLAVPLSNLAIPSSRNFFLPWHVGAARCVAAISTPAAQVTDRPRSESKSPWPKTKSRSNKPSLILMISCLCLFSVQTAFLAPQFNLKAFHTEESI